MRTFAVATPSPKPRTKDVNRIATLYAGIITVMVVAQLFTFEALIELFVSFGMPFGETVPYIVAAVLVVSEVFALPFLLRMPLSKAFRWVSMVSGWMVASIWVKLSVWVLFADPTPETVGFLGTVVNTMPGLWAVFVALAFVVLAGWISWGLWPGKRRK
jgi:hypothetical protein